MPVPTVSVAKLAVAPPESSVTESPSSTPTKAPVPATVAAVFRSYDLLAAFRLLIVSVFWLTFAVAVGWTRL